MNESKPVNKPKLEPEDQIGTVVKIIVMKNGKVTNVNGFPADPAVSLDIMSQAQLVVTNFWLKKAVDGELHHGEGSKIIIPNGVFVPDNLTKKVQ